MNADSIAKSQQKSTRGIRKMFSAQLADTYELVNGVLTLGLDRIWRRRAAKIAVSAGGGRWIDVCCGTGDMIARLHRRAPENVQLFAADFSLPMMQQAVKRRLSGVRFILTDTKALAFAGGSFDLVTMSFATRNNNLGRESLLQTFREYRRIMKPGGLFVTIETTQPRLSLIRRGFHLYAKTIIGPIGGLISGSKGGYTYLSKTMRTFYSAEELAALLREAGFREVSVRRLFPGIVAIHSCIK